MLLRLKNNFYKFFFQLLCLCLLLTVHYKGDIANVNLASRLFCKKVSKKKHQQNLGSLCGIFLLSQRQFLGKTFNFDNQYLKNGTSAAVSVIQKIKTRYGVLNISLSPCTKLKNFANRNLKEFHAFMHGVACNMQYS